MIPNVYILLAIAAFSFSAGWQVNSWRHDALELAAKEAIEKVEKAVSAKLEDKLSGLRANERVIEREKIKIINRDVYSNVCLDVDGLRIANNAKGGATKPAD